METIMSVYMIGDVDIHNIEEYKKYMDKVKPMIESYGGEYLIRGGEIDSLETNLWKFINFMEITEFDSR